MCDGDELVSKKQKTELDCFTTVEDACKHYFDASCLEEAIWDYLGVPRIIVLDGSQEKMHKLGWIRCRVKTTKLGDSSVRLGYRVVHVYDDGCSVWQEAQIKSP